MPRAASSTPVPESSAVSASPLRRTRAGILALYPIWVFYPLLLLGAVAIGMPADAGGRVALFPPVFVNLGLLWGFGRTLRTGRMPMVERFVRAAHRRRAGAGADPLLVGEYAVRRIRFRP
jgi:uncharacterized membrane protein